MPRVGARRKLPRTMYVQSYQRQVIYNPTRKGSICYNLAPELRTCLLLPNTTEPLLRGNQGPTHHLVGDRQPLAKETRHHFNNGIVEFWEAQQLLLKREGRRFEH